MEVEAIGEAVEVGLPTVFKNIDKFLVLLTLAFLAKLAAQ